LLVDYEYTEDEADVLLETATIEEKRRERETSVGVLDTLFIEDKITEEQYRLRLKQLEFSNKAIEQRVMYVKIRKEGKVRRLTPAQWARLFREKMVTEDEFRTAMSGYGSPGDDIDKLVMLYAPPVPKPPKPIETVIGLEIEPVAIYRPVIIPVKETVIGLEIEPIKEYRPKEVAIIETTIGLQIEPEVEYRPKEVAVIETTIGLEVEPI